MKTAFYRSLIICVILVLSFQSFAQGNHYFSGNTLKDPYGRFQLYFPGEPKYAFQDLDTDMGNVRMYQFIFETSDAAYMVSYVDYPAAKIAGQDKEALLKRAAGGFINALKLTSKSEVFINYESYRGIMFLADDGEKFTSMRDFLVENRLYQLGIFKYGEIDAREENEFFDSFVITK